MGSGASNATQPDAAAIMLFGATPFASTTFGIGSQNVVVLVNGERVNISIGNSTVAWCSCLVTI